MKVCVVGTGYVGLVTGTCLAEIGNTVCCVDINQAKIDMLNRGEVPIYEPGLEELIESNTREERLSFSTDLKTAVEEADICFIAVGTPQDDEGAADLSAVYAVAKNIAQNMNGYKVVVSKSTVPVGTGEEVKAIVAEHTTHPFSVVSNPEFLKQGNAVEDFLKPDRIVIGAEDPRAAQLMQELYSPFMRTGNPILMMDLRSSEMTKYVANAFLATKISFINEMANICEAVGADIEKVRHGVTSDVRIGKHFLFPGIGYGGSCFPKDVKALIRTANQNNSQPRILESVDSLNQAQRLTFLHKIMEHFNHDLSGKTIAVWGLAFKPRTDDMREAPSVTIIKTLLEKGATVQAFDPKAVESAKQHFGDQIVYTKSAYEAMVKADCLVILTEWREFHRPSFEKMKSLLMKPVVFDGRNLYDPDRMQERGFYYVSIGRPETGRVEEVMPVEANKESALV